MKLKKFKMLRRICANKKEDDFNKYIDLRELGIDIRNGLLTLDEAKQLPRNMKNEF